MASTSLGDSRLSSPSEIIKSMAELLREAGNSRALGATTFVTERENLHSSPAIRIAGRAAMELAEVGPDDIDHVDLYSCFPSAVQIGATELGLSQDRQLTVTGGLTFAGGPLNNYVTHGIATMVAQQRRLDINPMTGVEIHKLIDDLYATPPEETTSAP